MLYEVITPYWADASHNNGHAMGEYNDSAGRSVLVAANALDILGVDWLLVSTSARPPCSRRWRRRETPHERDRPDPPPRRPDPERAAGRRAPPDVITSYSIHYTKLYEMLS